MFKFGLALIVNLRFPGHASKMVLKNR
ncbi:hypothetical protein CFIO01_13758 [Colletotrichum fioriniae PJ7]|uniref:Uncharacterized protein n=1 Tax=Colletotrichum fioriniae PJ7 TaxID=1445577 RepID=A0A010Q9V7_9PEZI|nr:hypothetical protein CFIO01_13758 [Colletotrichum fioriniae PJ7]